MDTADSAIGPSNYGGCALTSESAVSTSLLYQELDSRLCLERELSLPACDCRRQPYPTTDVTPVSTEIDI
jgi:hypothetical protein